MKQDFAVTVTRADGAWQIREFEDDFTSLRTSIRAVRNLRAESAAFAMLCVEDDYFVLVRPTPKGVRLLISDASAASEDDFALEVLETLGVDTDDIDEDPWAEGDFDILADLGISEQVMAVICDETDWWASEQLQRLAEEMGMEDEFADALDA
ncbi:tRNA adenosine deaminase-associated protein [Corynebacterium pelargi]|uniref:tRNA adenosine deaminase-associated protein n=1 Tax=Corynebacterium pelargi TaxID=1471400 RepID=UPI0010090C1B|nr:tRNA adenosine deaminase-associated protein [Corynebacterium pelargi]